MHQSKVILISIAALISAFALAQSSDLTSTPSTDTVNSLCRPTGPKGGRHGGGGGKGCVPEPASVATLAIGGAALLRRRKNAAK